MANFRIITNNPAAAAKYPGVTTLLRVTVSGIFEAARDSIHLGASLINHPLAGSVKPNESPYKSLVLSLEGASLDFGSLKLIEGAREVLDKLAVKNIDYTESILDDFQAIDLDLLDSAIKALPAEYHF